MKTRGFGDHLSLEMVWLTVVLEITVMIIILIIMLTLTWLSLSAMLSFKSPLIYKFTEQVKQTGIVLHNLLISVVV